jgi:hypothetical protein
VDRLVHYNTLRFHVGIAAIATGKAHDADDAG